MKILGKFGGVVVVVGFFLALPGLLLIHLGGELGGGRRRRAVPGHEGSLLD